MTIAGTSLRSLTALAFAALLALSLVATAADALAATPLGGDQSGSDAPRGLVRDFFHGRGLLGTTWE